MTLLIPPGYANCILRWKLNVDPQPMEITFGVGNGLLPIGQTEADQIANAWSTAWGAGGLRNSYTYIGAELHVGQDGGPPVVYEAPRSVVGTGTNGSLPQNCALLVRKTSALGGRHGRGRWYQPAGYLQEALVDDNGTIDATFLAAMQANATAFKGALTLPMVILHQSGGTPPAPTPVTSLICDPRIATQRRRLR